MRIPTFARKVFDVTGAGDTVIATVALALSSGVDLLTACTLSNYAAGVVVAQVGAATATVGDLLEVVDELPEPQVSKWSFENYLYLNIILSAQQLSARYSKTW